MYPQDVFLGRHPFFRQDVAIQVGDVSLGNVIHHHVIVAHVQRLRHHVVELLGVAGHDSHVSPCQEDEQIEDGS